MKTIPTIAEIAAGLTPSQRAAILWLPQDGEPRSREKAGTPAEVSFFWLSDWGSGDRSKKIVVKASFVRILPPKVAPPDSGRVWLPSAYALTPLGRDLRKAAASLHVGG